MAKTNARPVRHVQAGWAELVLVCRKCSKKLHGGFGPDGDERFGKALRAVMTAGEPRAKKRRARHAVVEVGCFGLCPKDAVVAVHAARPDDWLVIPRGTTMVEAAGQLGVGGGPAVLAPSRNPV